MRSLSTNTKELALFLFICILHYSSILWQDFLSKFCEVVMTPPLSSCMSKGPWYVFKGKSPARNCNGPSVCLSKTCKKCLSWLDFSARLYECMNVCKQAWTELGQDQLQLGLNFTSINLHYRLTYP